MSFQVRALLGTLLQIPHSHETYLVWLDPVIKSSSVISGRWPSLYTAMVEWGVKTCVARTVRRWWESRPHFETFKASWKRKPIRLWTSGFRTIDVIVGQVLDFWFHGLGWKLTTNERLRRGSSVVRVSFIWSRVSVQLCRREVESRPRHEVVGKNKS